MRQIQVSCRSNYSDFTVHVEQLGSNPTSLEGKRLGGKGFSASASHGDVLEILSGEYKHKIVFDPSPDRQRGEGEEKRKRPMSQVDEVSAAKKSKGEDDGGGPGLWSNLDLSVTPKTKSENFKWEEAGGGAVLIMTTKGCQPSKKASSHGWVKIFFSSLIYTYCT